MTGMDPNGRQQAIENAIALLFAATDKLRVGDPDAAVDALLDARHQLTTLIASLDAQT